MGDLWVVMDANFLMIPEEHGVDIFSEIDRILDRRYELVVPEVVLGELERLKRKGSPSERRAARVALQLAERTKKVPSEESADEEILRLAQEKDCVVGTNDSVLRKRLRQMGTPTIFLRQKSHLDIDSRV